MHVKMDEGVTLSPDSYTHHKELISGVRSPR